MEARVLPDVSGGLQGQWGCGSVCGQTPNEGGAFVTRGDFGGRFCIFPLSVGQGLCLLGLGPVWFDPASWGFVGGAIGTSLRPPLCWPPDVLFEPAWPPPLMFPSRTGRQSLFCDNIRASRTLTCLGPQRSPHCPGFRSPGGPEGSSRHLGSPCLGVPFGVVILWQLEVYLAQAQGDAFRAGLEALGSGHQDGVRGQAEAGERRWVQRERPGNPATRRPPGEAVGLGSAAAPWTWRPPSTSSTGRGDNDGSATPAGSARRRWRSLGGRAEGALGH